MWVTKPLLNLFLFFIHIWDLLGYFFIQKIAQHLKGFQKWADTKKKL